MAWALIGMNMVHQICHLEVQWGHSKKTKNKMGFLLPLCNLTHKFHTHTISCIVSQYVLDAKYKSTHFFENCPSINFVTIQVSSIIVCNSSLYMDNIHFSVHHRQIGSLICLHIIPSLFHLFLAQVLLHFLSFHRNIYEANSRAANII